MLGRGVLGPGGCRAVGGQRRTARRSRLTLPAPRVAACSPPQMLGVLERKERTVEAEIMMLEYHEANRAWRAAAAAAAAAAAVAAVDLSAATVGCCCCGA